MTKPLVQGQIGYWANGKLVHMPKRRPDNLNPSNINHGASNASAHMTRNRERKAVLITRQRQRRQKKLAQLKLHQNIPQSLVEQLKNASKNGTIAPVWSRLGQLQACIDSRYMKHATNFFRLWTRYIFVPDIEERTALYYASLTGHCHIVELYMSLYLMSAIQISEATIVASRTFREWFSSMGGTHKMILHNNFTLKDYDLCVLNGLNEDVRDVLTRKKVTISDAMNIVKKALDPDAYGRIIKSISARMENIKIDVDRMRKFLRINKSTKHKKPVLNNCIFDSGGRNGNNDLWVIEEDAYTGINSERDEYVDDVITANDQEVAQCIIIKSERSAYTNLSIASSNIIYEQDFIEMKDIVEDLNSISDFTFLNDAISIDYSEISLVEFCGDNEEETSEGWDVVSDLQSVKSVDTCMTITSKPAMPLSASYKDMLLKKTKPIIVCDGLTNILHVTTPLKTNKELKSVDEVKTTIPEVVVDDGNMCDAHWERDGFKNGRGGKLGRLFLGNARSQNDQNWGKWDKRYDGNPSAERRRDLQTRCRKMTN